MCQDCITAIMDWEPPKDLAALRSFLGFCNFYRGFIPAYSDLTAPLTSLLKKDVPYHWTLVQQKAFDALKQAFVSGNIVRYHNSSLESILETDASDFAISGILSQRFNDAVHPITFYSRKPRDAELNYDTHRGGQC